MTIRIAALALGLGACASTLTPERVTPELWAEALQHAQRLSDGELRVADASPVKVVHMPLERIRQIKGASFAQACAYVRAESTLYCRDDRPWQSDRGHHMGIAIHEASHAMQPDTMPKDCREAQARSLQILWLVEQGEHARAYEVAQGGLRYRCRHEPD
jgi:hypothetical protein